MRSAFRLAVVAVVAATCACATGSVGAIQQTAVGASLATTGALGIVGTGGVAALLASSGPTSLVLEPAVPQLVGGVALSVALLATGAVMMATAEPAIDVRPRVEVVEKATAAPAAKRRPVTVAKAGGVSIAKVGALLSSRDPLVTSSFFVSGERLDGAIVRWSVDIQSSAWRFKGCTPLPFADAEPVATKAATYGGAEQGAGVVERFIVDLDRGVADRLAGADSVELHICDEVFVLADGSRRRLGDLLMAR